MTIQLLPAYDANPPKIQILPKYELTPKRKRYFKIMGGVTLVLGLLSGLMNRGNFISSFMSVVIIALVIQGIVFYIQFALFHRNIKASNGANLKAQHHIHDYYKKAFFDSGYHIDYEAPGILIDCQHKKIGFTITGAGVDPTTKRFMNMLVCDYADIRSCSVSTKEFTERVGGQLKRSDELFTNRRTTYVTPSYEETTAILYRVKVTINYPDSPLQSFEAMSEADAQQWVARLDSLVNG